ncbi:Anti-repressor protein [Candidatus Liberibacter solanacearum]|uniref:Anti-repressor protein n=1 Tax=Candidatus Liberibacter solanacearum TaxID=556287 RepID=A0A0F4VPA0_9HYPH|nr:Rha family transcriptional regulator [Candidatus Liberibacter solanacearum]KJZ82502.1 Anti-repressor protein [Candidatus Liberibacter solanacearum]
MSNISETMQEINRASNIKTMSSREIAKLTGKEHKHVLRDIENILKDAEIDQSKFGHIYLDKYKREQREYRLPYREALLVTSGYDTKQRLKIIDRWAELEVEKRQQPKAKPQKSVSPTSYVKTHQYIKGVLSETGLKENQLLLATNRGVAKLTGFDLLSSSGVKHLPSPDNDEYLTPTAIGELLNPVIKAKALNSWMTYLGLQISKHTGKGYIPTPKGEELGGKMCDVPLQHVEGSTQSLKWNPKVIIPYLQKLIGNHQTH